MLQESFESEHSVELAALHHKSLLPVSRTRRKACPGVPRVTLQKYRVSWLTVNMVRLMNRKVNFRWVTLLTALSSVWPIVLSRFRRTRSLTTGSETMLRLISSETTAGTSLWCSVKQAPCFTIRHTIERRENMCRILARYDAISSNCHSCQRGAPDCTKREAVETQSSAGNEVIAHNSWGQSGGLQSLGPLAHTPVLRPRVT